MKNIILAFVLLFNIQLHANIDNQALTLMNNSEVLVNQKFFAGQVEFRVMNRKGKTVYQKNYETSKQFEIVVDLGILSEGEYEIEMSDKYKIIKKKARMNAQSTLLLQENTDVIHKPQFKLAESYIDMYFIPLQRKTTIRITDIVGNLLYRETINSSGSINKRYHIKDLKEDTYKITVIIPNHRFTKEFKM